MKALMHGAKGRQDKLTIIVDFNGFQITKVNTAASKSLLNLLSGFYPERLYRCYLLDAPWVFNAGNGGTLDGIFLPTNCLSVINRRLVCRK